MDVIGSAHAFLSKHAPDFCLGVLAGSDVQAKLKAALRVRPAAQRERSSPLDPVLGKYRSRIEADEFPGHRARGRGRCSVTNVARAIEPQAAAYDGFSSRRAACWR